MAALWHTNPATAFCGFSGLKFTIHTATRTMSAMICRDAVVSFLKNDLGGKVPDSYRNEEGRIIISE